jgi:hypothetical protein
MIVAKTMDGKLVEVISFVDRVGFSDERGWILICRDFQWPNRKKDQFKWVPAYTPFIWVRYYLDCEESSSQV